MLEPPMINSLQDHQKPKRIYSLKPQKDKLLDRATVFLLKYGLTPNKITATGLILGIFCGLLLANRVISLALSLGILSAFCDILDGTIARRNSSVTRFGLYFDSVADRCTELAFVLGGLFGAIIYPIGTLAIAGSTSLLCMRVLGSRYGIKTDFVWFGRVERVLCLFIGVLSPLILLNTGLFLVAGILGFISSIQICIALLRKRYKTFFDANNFIS